MLTLSIIIPCYNEGLNLPVLFEKCDNVFKNHNNIEVLLVNNGSTDNSKEILSALTTGHNFIRMVEVIKNQGYGFGILAGLKEAKGDVLAWTHADMQTDPQDIITGFHFFKNHKEPEKLFLKGKRFGRPLSDSFFTLGMSIFETLLLKKILYDINAQPTMFHKTFLEKWINPPYDFSLDLYSYYLAKRYSLEIKKIPVFFNKRLHGISHWNINWKSKIKFINRTISYSMKLKNTLK